MNCTELADVQPLVVETPLDDVLEQASLVRLLVVADGRIVATKVVKDAADGGGR